MMCCLAVAQDNGNLRWVVVTRLVWALTFAAGITIMGCMDVCWSCISGGCRFEAFVGFQGCSQQRGWLLHHPLEFAHDARIYSIAAFRDCG